MDCSTPEPSSSDEFVPLPSKHTYEADITIRVCSPEAFFKEGYLIEARGRLARQIRYKERNSKSTPFQVLRKTCLSDRTWKQARVVVDGDGPTIREVSNLLRGARFTEWTPPKDHVLITRAASCIVMELPPFGEMSDVNFFEFDQKKAQDKLTRSLCFESAHWYLMVPEHWNLNIQDELKRQTRKAKELGINIVVIHSVEGPLEYAKSLFETEVESVDPESEIKEVKVYDKPAWADKPVCKKVIYRETCIGRHLMYLSDRSDEAEQYNPFSIRLLRDWIECYPTAHMEFDVSKLFVKPLQENLSKFLRLDGNCSVHIGSPANQ